MQVKVENKPQQPKQTDDDIITKEQKEELEILIEKAGGDKINICNHFKVEALNPIQLTQVYNEQEYIKFIQSLSAESEVV